MDELFKLLVELLGTDNIEIRTASELEKTVPDMLSSDYKDRLKAEYHQTRIRYHRLCKAIKLLECGEKGKENNSLALMKRQKSIMHDYITVLVERATIEDVSLI